MRAGTSNPASAGASFGGVARNVAETLARLENAVALVSRVGDDAGGAALVSALGALGCDVAGVETAPMPPPRNTSPCSTSTARW